MLGIRQKLILGFGGLFVLVGGIGLLTMAKISVLGRSIDVILRENYKSVIACQSMKESLERIDSGILFFFLDRPEEGRRLIDENLRAFGAALETELSNITLPEEGERARRIPGLFKAFASAIDQADDPSLTRDRRQALYLDELYPRFLELKGLAQEILDMNQANMVQANDRAREQAASAHRQLLLVILGAAAVALIYSLSIRRWILWPLRRLTAFADEARRGNLDLVLQPKGRDEIGRLAEAFNDMAEGLRGLRRQDRLEVQRTRRATEEVFKALPTPIAVLDLDGRVELATEPADRLFGLKAGVDARGLGEDRLTALINRALAENRPAEPKDGAGGFLQRFDGLQERLFHPGRAAAVHERRVRRAVRPGRPAARRHPPSRTARAQAECGGHGLPPAEDAADRPADVLAHASRRVPGRSQPQAVRASSGRPRRKRAAGPHRPRPAGYRPHRIGSASHVASPGRAGRPDPRGRSTAISPKPATGVSP